MNQKNVTRLLVSLIIGFLSVALVACALAGADASTSGSTVTGRTDPTRTPEITSTETITDETETAVSTQTTETSAQPPAPACQTPDNAMTLAAVQAKLDKGDKNFSNQNLSGVDLSGKDLTEANFECANLTGTNLTGAILISATLQNAQLIMDAPCSPEKIAAQKCLPYLIADAAIKVEIAENAIIANSPNFVRDAGEAAQAVSRTLALTNELEVMTGAEVITAANMVNESVANVQATVTAIHVAQAAIATMTAMPTQTPTNKPIATLTLTPTPTNPPTPTATHTPSPTIPPTVTSTFALTVTPSPTPSNTPTPSPTPIPPAEQVIISAKTIIDALANSSHLDKQCLYQLEDAAEYPTCLRHGLYGANLTGADLTGAFFENVNFRKANLTSVSIAQDTFSGVNLTGANLGDGLMVNGKCSSRQGGDKSNLPDFYQAILIGTNFSGVCLRGASFISAKLIGAHFVGTDLTGADFYNAYLYQAQFNNANLTDAMFFMSERPLCKDEKDSSGTFNKNCLVYRVAETALQLESAETAVKSLKDANEALGNAIGAVEAALSKWMKADGALKEAAEDELRMQILNLVRAMKNVQIAALNVDSNVTTAIERTKETTAELAGALVIISGNPTFATHTTFTEEATEVDVSSVSAAGDIHSTANDILAKSQMVAGPGAETYESADELIKQINSELLYLLGGIKTYLDEGCVEDIKPAELDGCFPSLYQADLSGATVTNAVFTNADMRRVIFTGAINLNTANLSQVDLRGVTTLGRDLQGFNLAGANLGAGPGLNGKCVQDGRNEVLDLSGVNLSQANLAGVCLLNAQLVGVDLRNANLAGANLMNANLYDADLRNTAFYVDNEAAILIDATLAYADLTGADLYGVELKEADLTHADLTDANLTRAMIDATTTLTNAILKEATLICANLSNAHLIFVDISWADLRGANLAGADLSRSNLNGSNFTGAVYEQSSTRWPDYFNPLVAGAVTDDNFRSSMCTSIKPGE